jgi:hypothetical protein
VFPVELQGRLVGFQERTVLESTKTWDEETGKWLEMPKVLSSKGIPRDHVVMFGDRVQRSPHVVLCEGPIDAIKAHLCRANCAAMGKAVSRWQLQHLRDLGVRRVYLALDPDAAEETARLVRELSDLELYLMHPPPGYKDLGEMPMEAVLELFLRAPRVNPGHLFVYTDKRAEIL